MTQSNTNHQNCFSKNKLKKIDWSFLIQSMESNFKIQGLMIYGTLYEQLKELQKEIYSEDVNHCEKHDFDYYVIDGCQLCRADTS